jgi:type IV pilus assembly protein PilC
MPNFSYKARDADGKSVTGTMSAGTIADVGRALRAEGKFPITVNPIDAVVNAAGASRSSGGICVAKKEVIQIATQLAIMVETGVTIFDALECVASQSVKPKVKMLVSDLAQHVHSGSDFSTALSKHPRSFPQLFLALIRASEKSGALPKMLMRATAYLRDEADIVRKVKGAVTYPAIMFGFAVSTTVFLLIFVLPKFTALYASKKAALPVPTQILMAISDVLIGHWYLILPTLIIGVVLCGYGATRTIRGRLLAHTLQLRVPMIGPMFRQMYVCRSLRMIGTMAASGVHLVDCVTTARDLCGNVHYQKLWAGVEEQLHAGRQLSEPLFASWLMPRSISQMLSSAEKSGKLAQVMETVAGFSEQELKERITELTRYIEPAMIVLMGLIIGGVTLALLLPVFTISRVMSQ